MLTKIEQYQALLLKVEALESDLDELNPGERYIFDKRLEEGPDYDIYSELQNTPLCTGCDMPLAAATAHLDIGICNTCLQAWQDAAADNATDDLPDRFIAKRDGSPYSYEEIL